MQPGTNPRERAAVAEAMDIGLSLQVGKYDVQKMLGKGATGTVYLALDTFTVNLQEGERYMQVDVTLQVADQAQADAIKLHMPRVRSRLLALLSSKHAGALTTAADKQALAQEILAQVKLPFDAKAKPQQVDDVLFTSFVIQ